MLINQIIDGLQAEPDVLLFLLALASPFILVLTLGPRLAPRITNYKVGLFMDGIEQARKVQQYRKDLALIQALQDSVISPEEVAFSREQAVLNEQEKKAREELVQTLFYATTLEEAQQAVSDAWNDLI